MWNLVSHIMKRTGTDSIWEQGAKRIIWTQELKQQDGEINTTSSFITCTLHQILLGWKIKEDGEIKIHIIFYCFTVHFYSLNLIHTNQCTFHTKMYYSFKPVLKALKTFKTLRHVSILYKIEKCWNVLNVLSAYNTVLKDQYIFVWKVHWLVWIKFSTHNIVCWHTSL